MKKAKLFVVLSLLAALLAAGCGGAGAPAANSQTLTVANIADVVKLDPLYITDMASAYVAEQIYDRMLQYNAQGDLVGVLVQSWETSPDGLTWTFTLKEGVKFHDGTPFDAAAVKAHYDRIMDPANASPQANDCAIIAGITVVDPKTVTFALKQFSAAFADKVLVEDGFIESPAAVQQYGKDYASHPVGTGPFKFVRWVPDTEVVLEKNPEYFAGPAKLDKVVFKPIPDPATQIVELEAGTIDMILKVKPQDSKRLQASKDIQVYSIPDYSVRYLFMNVQKEFLGDKTVRQAIAHAIDTKGIFNNFLIGVAEPMDSAVAKNSWAYAPGMKQYEYSPEKAKGLLAQAGWQDTNGDGILEKGGKPFKLNYYTSDNRYLADKEIATAVANQLKAVGIDVSIKPMEWGAYLAAVDNGEHDMCILGLMGSTGEPSTVLEPLFYSHPQGWSNDMFYHNPALDKLLDQGVTAKTKAERQNFYRQVQETIAEDVPGIPLYSDYRSYAARQWVKGYKANLAKYLDLTGVSIEK